MQAGGLGDGSGTKRTDFFWFFHELENRLNVQVKMIQKSPLYKLVVERGLIINAYQ